MTELEDIAANIAYEGLQVGLRCRVQGLFEVMSSATVTDNDEAARHFRKGLIICLERFEIARKLINEAAPQSNGTS